MPKMTSEVTRAVKKPTRVMPCDCCADPMPADVVVDAAAEPVVAEGPFCEADEARPVTLLVAAAVELMLSADHTLNVTALVRVWVSHRDTTQGLRTTNVNNSEGSIVNMRLC